MRIFKSMKTYPRRDKNISVEDVQIVDRIVCDKCSVVLWNGTYDKKEFFSSASMWGKKHLEDFHLCANCYTWLMSNFTAKV